MTWRPITVTWEHTIIKYHLIGPHLADGIPDTEKSVSGIFINDCKPLQKSFWSTKDGFKHNLCVVFKV